MLSSTQSHHAGKKFYFIIFACLIFQLSVLAQFNVCPTGSYTQGVVFAHAVDEQIYWAVRRDVPGTIVTTDGGNTWAVNSFVDPKNFGVSCVHAFNADIAFLVASTIFKTTDRGTTWSAATGVFTNPSSFPNTIHFFDQNNGVAMGDPVDGYFEIYTTTNAGVNWVRVPSSNIPDHCPEKQVFKTIMLIIIIHTGSRPPVQEYLDRQTVDIHGQVINSHKQLEY